MVLKRCLYFFLSVWLLNSIVCFHADRISTPIPDHIQYPGESCDDGGDTALGHVAQIFDANDHNNSDSDSPSSKRSPRKILPRRIAELNAQLPILLDFVKGNIAVDLHHTYGIQWLNKAFLPGYYNFLFRYKPF